MTLEPLTIGVIMARMADRFGELIERTTQENTTWRIRPSRALAARRAMAMLLEVSIQAAGEARRRGSPVVVEDYSTIIADRFTISLLQREASFSRDSDNTITVYKKATQNSQSSSKTFDPPSEAELTAWANGVLDDVIVFIIRDT